MSAITWLTTNWQEALLVLLTVDQLLIGIFPQVAILGNLKDILTKLKG